MPEQPTEKLKLLKPLGSDAVTLAKYNENLQLIEDNAAAQTQVDEPFYLREAAYNDILDEIQLTFGPGRAEFLNQLVTKTGESVHRVSTPLEDTSYYVYLTQAGEYTHSINGAAIPGAVQIWKITTGHELNQISIEDLRGQLCGASARIVQDNLSAHLGAGGSEHATVTQTVNGFMKATDKAKLDGIPSNPAPVGALMPYAGPIIKNPDTGEILSPSGWLLCNGQVVSRSTYSALFAVIGTTYGAGTGSTTFNVPDLRGRSLIGMDNMGGTSANVVTNANANVLGGKDGAEKHKLLIQEIPGHSHNVEVLNVGGSGGEMAWDIGAADRTWITKTTTPTGGDQPHNSMPPYIALNYIIKC